MRVMVELPAKLGRWLGRVLPSGPYSASWGGGGSPTADLASLVTRAPSCTNRYSVTFEQKQYEHPSAECRCHTSLVRETP